MPHMVRRAYLLDDLNPFSPPTVRRVLVDAHSVFIPSEGWHSRSYIEANYRLVYLPGEIEHHDWWGGWENGQNARLLDWGWCYGHKRQAHFVACRKVQHPDGSISVSMA